MLRKLLFPAVIAASVLGVSLSATVPSFAATAAVMTIKHHKKHHNKHHARKHHKRMIHASRGEPTKVMPKVY